MDIFESTQRYEAWLGRHIPVIQADLEEKHRQMRQGLLPFLRATFYRWVQFWPELCPELQDAPPVLSTGDLHAENFGTWRDAESRLAWGINDFDEAAVLPYPFDLVRLAASARLASLDKTLAIEPGEACAAILDGYADCLGQGGRPFVLAEDHQQLREMAEKQLKDPEHFWQKLADLPSLDSPPAEVTALLKAALPVSVLEMRMVHRVSGLGSLGRERYAAVAEWCGGRVAREVKRLLLPACLWEQRDDRAGAIQYQAILDHAIRAADPFARQQGGWIVCRLAPDCSRIALADLPKERDEARLLNAMGFEAANIHLASDGALAAGTANRVLVDLKNRPRDWLQEASQTMAKAIARDWEDYIKR